MNPTLVEAFHSLTVPDLRLFATVVPFALSKSTKADMIAVLKASMSGDALRQLWGQLSASEQCAVAEAIHHPFGLLDMRAFQAKYQTLPKLNEPGSSRHDTGNPTLLALFIHHDRRSGHYFVPSDLQATLVPWVPKPKAMVVQTVPPDESDDGLTCRQTETEALQDLKLLLRTIEQTKVQVSDKTGVASAAAQRLVADKLTHGDFYALDEAVEGWQQTVGPIKAFAWPLLLQAGGLATCVSGRLALTPAGIKAIVSPPAPTIRALWRKWVNSRLLDEFSRVDIIKGQQSAGRVMTAVAPRRQAIEDALRECPVGQWIDIDALGRFMRATGHDFAVTHDPWKLYLFDKQYGAMGYDGHNEWHILEQRYMTALLMEYAATLGLVDVAYVHPAGATDDFRGIWGADELRFLSRYDGLERIRITELGAYVLGVRTDYVPQQVTSPVRLQVLRNLWVQVLHGLLEADAQQHLETWARPAQVDTWELCPLKAAAAIEKGYETAALRGFLQAHTADDLPDEVLAFLHACDRSSKAFKTAGDATLVEGRDRSTVDAAMADSVLSKLAHRIGPKELVVRNEHTGKFRQRLLALGLGLVG